MSPVKGKAIVGQSGGCTAVINQSLAGVVERARKTKSITHVWGTLHGVTGLLKGDFIDLKAQPCSLIRGIRSLPSAILGSSRQKLKQAEEYDVVRNLQKWNVRYLFMIGGNDTAETILRIARAAQKENYDLRVSHIPKTIDNDLVETDHCPGYGSAARFAAITTQETGLDTKAMRYVDPVKIIELMGRNSGWIVAASALLKKTESDPPHLLLVPEAAFDEKNFLTQVEEILKRIGYCVIVISETIRDAKGNRLGARSEGITQDPFGHPYVEGAAAYLARLVENRLKVRARYDKPGTLQRMSMAYASPVDQREAFLSGYHAVTWALQGISKVMVSFQRESGPKYHIRYRPVPLEKISRKERYLPDHFLNRDKTGITADFVRYASPLIGGANPAFPVLKPKIPRL
ncbi:MAG: 6-phosphofructokinase [Candidatus Omnitrophica bacterium]|nr:6-phosphofructokinase [Candidatus Omnitrophota bacterium]